ncbi:unnamed protein product [Rotaria sordida]|uniref:Uncharacterized protein n=1 Tax=Rotaria sordida TaxID=392033 RepID=A0A819DUS0_9BILA|nr:unnamed protein product [Rotaria sordida]
MPRKRNNTKFTRKYQEQTGPLSSDNDDDNNNNRANVNPLSLPPTRFGYELLLDQYKMIIDENKRLKNQIEYFEKQLMDKEKDDTGNFLLRIPRVAYNQLNEGNEAEEGIGEEGDGEEANENDGKQQQQEDKDKDEEKKKNELKKKIKKIANVLGLSYNELKGCKKKRITITCRKVMKQIYQSRDERAMERIKTMCPNKVRAIRCIRGTHKQ